MMSRHIQYPERRYCPIWLQGLVFSLALPPTISFACYLPFYALAKTVNTVYYHDHFYFAAAIATWPTFSVVVAIVLTRFLLRFNLGWFWRVMGLLHGLAAIYYTECLNVLLQLSSFARTGLDSWPGRPGVWTTPRISAALVPLSYLVITTIVIALNFRRNRR